MRALTLFLAIGATTFAQSAVACEWASLGQRRGAADRIVEGRVASVRIARVWVHDWKIQIDRVATVEPVTTVKGGPQAARFEYRFSTHESHDPDWSCSSRPDPTVEAGETGYFLWERLQRPTLVLTPAEFRQRDLDN
ncbi:hypothetical protein N0B44_31950 [Roseibacterium beibuensis]|nr:hypothetical protein [Roseibacterium beibuensis]